MQTFTHTFRGETELAGSLKQSPYHCFTAGNLQHPLMFKRSKISRVGRVEGLFCLEAARWHKAERSTGEWEQIWEGRRFSCKSQLSEKNDCRFKGQVCLWRFLGMFQEICTSHTHTDTLQLRFRHCWGRPHRAALYLRTQRDATFTLQSHLFCLLILDFYITMFIQIRQVLCNIHPFRKSSMNSLFLTAFSRDATIRYRLGVQRYR